MASERSQARPTEAEPMKKGRLAGAFREVFVYGVLLAFWLLTMEAVITVLINRLQAAKVQLAGPVSMAVVIVAMPAWLVVALVLLVDKSLSPRWSFGLRAPRLTGGTNGPVSAKSEGGQEVFEEAVSFWDHERHQLDALRWRFRLHGAFYGFFASLSFAIPLVVAPDVIVNPRGALDGAGAWRSAAVAVGTAAIVCFVRDLARMLVRAANRDSSSQMFAWSLKRLFVILAATVLLSCLQGFSDLKMELFHSPIGHVLMGAGVAVLGERGASSVTERVGKALGSAPPKRQPGEDLAKIDGLEEDDVGRLAEEGIDSIHALAFYSTPKLFFSTPYSLARICDWQDQALLVARLGEATARLFRDQLLIRGAVDARSMACRFVQGELADDKREDLCKILGFSYFQAESAMRRLACDEVSRKLLVFREAAPYSEEHERVFVPASGSSNGASKPSSPPPPNPFVEDRHAPEA